MGHGQIFGLTRAAILDHMRVLLGLPRPGLREDGGQPVLDPRARPLTLGGHEVVLLLHDAVGVREDHLVHRAHGRHEDDDGAEGLVDGHAPGEDGRVLEAVADGVAREGPVERRLRELEDVGGRLPGDEPVLGEGAAIVDVGEAAGALGQGDLLQGARSSACKGFF